MREGRLAAAQRCCSIYNLAQEDVVNLWRQQYADHKYAVLDYFGDSPRFLHFDITRHGLERLRAFFGADVPVRIECWRKRGTAEERALRHASRT
jgi:hypothetical protein